MYIDSTTATTVPAPKQSVKEINMSQTISSIPQDKCKDYYKC
ncbi:MAG: hypothetical protein AB8V03_02615 [Francisella endosymbiont of Hyalomma asiaticum]